MTTVSIVRRRQGGMSPLAPPYYLGRPARVWFEALRPQRSPTPIPPTPSATTPAGVHQSSSSARLAATCPAREDQASTDMTRTEPRNEHSARSRRRAVDDARPVARHFDHEVIARTNTARVTQSPGVAPHEQPTHPAEPCRK
jgi:hypothetical protein